MKKLLLLILVSARLLAAPGDSLKIKPVYGKQARVITYILSSNHFRKVAFNDSLSSVALTLYINQLDPSKSYFLQSDIDRFQAQYSSQLDDFSRNEEVKPAFSIFNVFFKRFQERQAYIQTLIHTPFTFNTEEYYETDREKAPWCKNEQELNELWRKIVKSQALSYKLTNQKPEEIQKNLTKRYELLNKQVMQLNSDDVFGMYMNAIAESYDPHTNYLTPLAAGRFKESMSLSLEGIGAKLRTEDDGTKIVEIIAGGPADISKKIFAEDLIIGVAQGTEGEMVNVQGWRIDDVVKLIKGPKGTTVRLLFHSSKTGVKGAPEEISLVRDKIKLEEYAAKKKIISTVENGKQVKWGMIELAEFYMDFDEYNKGNPNYRSTSRDIKKIIEELKKENVRGIIIDLRDNGGGSLNEAIELTGLFIKDGPVVQVRNSENQVEVLPDTDKSTLYTGPLVVLTNRRSASASEIFASAIQDYKRGVVVGESTFGKGTVQTMLDLNRYIQDTEPSGSLKLTYQKFYRVNGNSTQHKGVTPDVPLPSPLDPEQLGESSMPNALPWDVIEKTTYQQANTITDKTISSLNANLRTRLKTDNTLKKFVEETKEAKKIMGDTRISLNESTRRKEMDEMEKKKDKSKLNVQLQKENYWRMEDVEKMNDEYLREGLIILADLAKKRIG